MTFENILREMEKIVRKLEDKNTGLDEGLKEFERGAALTKQALELLKTGRGKLSLIQKDMEKLLETPFEIPKDEE